MHFIQIWFQDVYAFLADCLEVGRVSTVVLSFLEEEILLVLLPLNELGERFADLGKLVSLYLKLFGLRSLRRIQFLGMQVSCGVIFLQLWVALSFRRVGRSGILDRLNWLLFSLVLFLVMAVRSLLLCTFFLILVVIVNTAFLVQLLSDEILSLLMSLSLHSVLI